MQQASIGQMNKEYRSPMRSLIWAGLINVIGNVALWSAAIYWRFTHEDDQHNVDAIMRFMYVGYLLLLVNALVLFVVLVRSIRDRKWTWTALASILLLLLAYEAVFIRGLYAIVFITPKHDGAFL